MAAEADTTQVQSAAIVPQEIDPNKELIRRAVEKAKEIADAGQTFEYILAVWQKRHSGDGPLGKALLFSLGSQSCSNSKGIHQIATGESGYGKSDGINQMCKLVYTLYSFNGGVTPQTLFYSELPDGIVIGLEDVQWNSELGISVKRISSCFQEGAPKMSTKELEGIEVRTAKRIAFWASTVDNQCDEQLRDRFLMYQVRSGHERANEIINHMQEQDEGSEQVPADYELETKVCQALTYDLKLRLYHVVIPFAKRMKFEGDPRAYALFSDMIKAGAVFRYAKREEDEVGRLIATTEDFENAKELYIELGGHDRDKFQGTELEILKAIVGKGTASQADIQEATGLSPGRVSDVLNGRGKDGQGLVHKCKHLIVEEGRPKKYRLTVGFNPFGKVDIELA